MNFFESIFNSTDLSDDLYNMQKIFSIFIVNAQINNYAFELAALGKIKPKERFPIEEALRDMNLSDMVQENTDDSFYEGAAIDKNLNLQERDYDYFCREFFDFNMYSLFIGSSDKKSYEKADCEINIENYINRLYLIFKDIMQTPAELDFCDIISEDGKDNFDAEIFLLKKFISAIFFKKIKRNSRIDKYIKPLNEIPESFKTLIVSKRNHYFLKENNIDSDDFKISVLYTLRFNLTEHYLLYRKKIKNWKVRNEWVCETGMRSRKTRTRCSSFPC